MSATILSAVLTVSQICLVAALVLAVMRALRGPRAQDRVLGLDTMYVCAMLLLIVTGMQHGTVYQFEAALVMGVLGFVATTAMATVPDPLALRALLGHSRTRTLEVYVHSGPDTLSKVVDAIG